jgi:hypothetical protein
MLCVVVARYAERNITGVGFGLALCNVVFLAPEIVEDGDYTVGPTRQVSGSLGTVDKLYSVELHSLDVTPSSIAQAWYCLTTATTAVG